MSLLICIKPNNFGPLVLKPYRELRRFGAFVDCPLAHPVAGTKH
jgi:hypothetical protein